MQKRFNIRKSISFPTLVQERRKTAYSSQYLQKKYIIISIFAEKASGNILHSFMIKQTTPPARKE